MPKWFAITGIVLNNAAGIAASAVAAVGLIAFASARRRNVEED